MQQIVGDWSCAAAMVGAKLMVASARWLVGLGGNSRRLRRVREQLDLPRIVEDHRRRAERMMAAEEVLESETVKYHCAERQTNSAARAGARWLGSGAVYARVAEDTG